jgi:hypothetical protein
MGFFTRFLKSGPPRDQWGRISLDITKGLEEARNIWFELCVEILRSASEDNSNKDYKIKIIQKKLTGNGLQAVKAYQLYWASVFIGHKAYIPRHEGKDFADILYAQVCGLELEECLHYFDRYHEMTKHGGTQLIRFTNDVARHITGNPAPLIESMIIGETFPLFSLSVQIIVAEAFGDLKTVAALNEKLSATVKK